MPGIHDIFDVITLVNPVTKPSKNQKKKGYIQLTPQGCQLRLGNVSEAIYYHDVIILGQLQKILESYALKDDDIDKGLTTDWICEEPTGVTNDVNNLFTLSQTPASVGRLVVVLNGRTRIWGVDYYLIGRVVHFAFPVAIGAKILCVYMPILKDTSTSNVINYIIEMSASGAKEKWTLPFVYSEQDNVMIVVDSNVRDKNVDYSINNKNEIEFTFTPAFGSVIMAIASPFGDPASDIVPVFTVPVGLVNGINQEFILQVEPVNNNRVVLFNDSGVRMPETDFYVSGNYLYLYYPPVGRISAYVEKQRDSAEPNYVLHGTKVVLADYSINLSDENILVDATSGPVTVTLPIAGSAPGKRYSISKVDNTINIVSIQTLLNYPIGDGAGVPPVGLLAGGETLSVSDSSSTSYLIWQVV